MNTYDPYNYLIHLRPRENSAIVSRNHSVWTSGRDGWITNPRDHGFLVHQTRVLSLYRCFINGATWFPVACSNVEQHSWLGYYIQTAPGIDSKLTDAGSGQVEPMTQQTLEMRISRFVGNGMHEDIDVTNYSGHDASFKLEFELDADFADRIEMRDERLQQGDKSASWNGSDGKWELSFQYHAEHAFDRQGNRGLAKIDRGLLFQIKNTTAVPSYANSKIAFNVRLPSRESWHVCFNLIPKIEDKILEPMYGCRSFAAVNNEYDGKRQQFLNDSTQISTRESASLSSTVISALEQAKHDLAALRLYDLDQPNNAWTMAAGLPVYVALFGRDALTASWEAALLNTKMMEGTLSELARWQGTETNDWRDEQPGRMLHEAHTGPLEILEYNPRKRYYGAATTTAFYPVIVSELWHWTGDKNLVRPWIGPALKCMEWLDRYADIDHDGFYEYKTRSVQGVRNQGWKDSEDAILYEDGRLVDPPIATCEEQGFVYLSKLHLSELLWWLDEKDQARALYRQAQELKKKFNDAFWMEKEGFFAMGLDSKKNPIRSIGSNAGHCLAAAIVDESLVRRTVQRFFGEDLFSGWGIRTLSSRHPAYNPYSYHCGSVWPVEQGTFALGLMRYGFHGEVQDLCKAQFDAASLFDFFRLPELFSGHARNSDHPFPAIYPNACSPQAWSASSVFCLVQSMLGLYPYAPLNVLLIDPHLPEWLPEITLRQLRVGAARVDIRFYRSKGGTSDYEILDKRGTLHVLRQPSPWSLTAGFGERIKDAISSLLP